MTEASVPRGKIAMETGHVKFPEGESSSNPKCVDGVDQTGQALRTVRTAHHHHSELFPASTLRCCRGSYHQQLGLLFAHHLGLREHLHGQQAVLPGLHGHGAGLLETWVEDQLRLNDLMGS